MRRSRKRGCHRVRAATPALVAVVALALAATEGAAVSASFWKVGSFEEAREGNLNGVSVLHDGRIVLSGGLTDLGAPPAQYVWGAARTGGGVVITTGTPGRVLRSDGGDWVELLTMETVDFPAMAVSPSGDVYVGTAPGGDVYRITPDGQSELFFESGDGYVWSMAYSDEHGLLVGTGDTASVYVVDEDGGGEVVYHPSDLSVSVVAAVGGRVLAGTSPEGLLLEVTPGEGVRVLYDAPFEEISGVAADPDGNLFFAASSVSFEGVLDIDSGYGNGLGEGVVYRMTDSGGAVEVWRARAPVTSLGLAPDGRPMAGVGTGGLVYAISGDGSADIVARLDAEEVLSIGDSPEVLVTSGGPGGVFEYSGGVARSGEYESPTLDASSVATWGELTWESLTPGGSQVELLTRSGNTSDPDETWSEWTAVSGDGTGPVSCPPARFLQWKAQLVRGSGSVTPTLFSVEAAYLRENLPPLLGSLVVHEPGDVVAGQGGGNDATSASQTLPGGIEVSYSVDTSTPSERGLPVLLRAVRTASWDALDPNGDALTFDIYVRADDEDDWKLLEGDVLRRTLHTWDTQTMTDGTYRLRVTATDRQSNPEETTLETSVVSQPFVVDHTPPRISDVRVEVDGDGLTVAGSAEDTASPVMFVDVSVDYGEWAPAFAADGMFDSRSESFRLTLEDTGPGEHVVAVRAVDRHGNPVVVRRVTR